MDQPSSRHPTNDSYYQPISTEENRHPAQETSRHTERRNRASELQEKYAVVVVALFASTTILTFFEILIMCGSLDESLHYTSNPIMETIIMAVAIVDFCCSTLTMLLPRMVFQLRDPLKRLEAECLIFMFSSIISNMLSLLWTVGLINIGLYLGIFLVFGFAQFPSGTWMWLNAEADSSEADGV